ncbi:MAG: acetoacetate decarboxylase family protein [Deltaproteobacteria bacterium]|nr:acetoacetate decarboxylase family protein [Deltaproteobacteria bacterium]MBW2420588.1 acetoacetate decarboxylase family protein [Deltaproteobacteria bacterium]
MSAPQTNPGDVVGWPLLKIRYRTDADKIAALLPPGIEANDGTNVYLNVYNYPVPDVPEYGILTMVDASYQGVDGLYTLGYGIDQESAIFVSRDMNGQPKYPCDVTYYRLGDRVTARCTHQGYTFLEFEGQVTGPSAELPDNYEENEWWVKVSRAVGGAEKSYDFPPHVVRVKSTYGTAWREDVEGKLTLRPSPWDPIHDLLPMRELVSAQLDTPTFLGRDITLEGKLDPEAFWPFSDTIGGSRWLGQNGAPPRGA